MEKAVYGMAADFSAIFYDIAQNGVTFFRVNSEKVTYAKKIVLTLNHEPKETITSSQNHENGELIIVQRGTQLFFKFAPTTKAGERIYRYVKSRKYRQCSYTFKSKKRVKDIEMTERFAWSLNTNEQIAIDEAVVLEVCLTNEPRDKQTFCTIDPNHPLLQGIDWITNVTLIEDDYWGEEIKRKEVLEGLNQEMQSLQEQIEAIDRQLIGGIHL